MDDQKDTLHRDMHQAHDVLRWKLDGLDEYGLRRPLVATGTNLPSCDWQRTHRGRLEQIARNATTS